MGAMSWMTTGGAAALALGLLSVSGALAAPEALPTGEAFTGSEEIAAPKGHDALRDARWCRVCHPAEQLQLPAWSKTAHHDQTCQDCHSGYHFNPHQPVKLANGATEGEGSTSAQRKAEAHARCGECHTDEAAKAADPKAKQPIIDEVVHGKGRKGSPDCADCHGDAHSVVLSKDLTVLQRREQMNARCIHCHEDEPLMASVDLTTRSVENYHHSVHGRQLGLGFEESPGCVDCHGGHTMTDFEKDGPKTCGECHSEATAEFVTLGDHRLYTRDQRPVSYYTLRFFAWLTFLSIAALAMHVLLDVLSTFRVAAKRRREERGDV